MRREQAMKKNPIALVILDGFGYNPKTEYNAIVQAKKPTLDALLAHYPHTLLAAAGQAVGLPEGYIGNSEVGHQTIGAGRIIPSAFFQLHHAIANGSFFTNPALAMHLESLAESGHTLHIMGLLSDAGVQCHQELIFALIEAAARWHIKKIIIHAFLDGRDVAPKSAAIYLEDLQDRLTQYPHAQLGSLCGRYYAMDRDNHWDRTKRAYDGLVNSTILPAFLSWQDAISHYYGNDITDEFIPPTVLLKNSTIKDNDGVIFANFREDRARQLAECFVASRLKGSQNNGPFGSMEASQKPNGDLSTRASRSIEANGGKDNSARGELVEPYEHSKSPILSFFISSIRYNPEFKNPVLLETKPISNTLKEILSKEGKTIFSIAETEKYAHVTYFFNGGHEKPFPGEEQVLIPSLPLKNYVDHPEMSAQKITDAVLESLQTNPCDFYLINYANADMVGHSGNLEATIKAVECLDNQIAQLYEQIVKKMNGTLIITADHGNAELKFDEKTGQPSTAHSTNKVPFICVKNELRDKKINLPLHGLADIAPFILKQIIT